MDAFADGGGMAPALQCRNHQSTGLLEGEVSKVKKVVSHEKVNGESDKNSVCKDTVLDTESSSFTSTRACDLETSCKLGLEGVDDTDTNGCILPGLNDILPSVVMPTVHFGQGDSTVTNVDDCNGWIECKRPNMGILQESNNISVFQSCKTMNKKIENISGKIVADKKECKTAGPLNGTCGLKLQLDSTSECNIDTMVKLIEESIDSEACKLSGFKCNDNVVTTDNTCDVGELHKASSTGLNPNVKGAMTDSQQESSRDSKKLLFESGRKPSFRIGNTARKIETVDSLAEQDLKTLLTLPVEQESASGSKIFNYSNTGNLPSAFEYKCPQSQTDEVCDEEAMLNYTDLLTRDLSKINMSDKLANTLQELAESLKGSPMLSLDESNMPQNAAIHCIDTVTSPHNSERSSVVGLDFSFDESRRENSRKEQETRIKTKAKSAGNGAGMLDFRLNLLKTDIHALRWHSTKTCVKKQLKQIVPQVWISFVNAWTVEMDAFRYTSPIEKFLDSREFWRKVFSDSKHASENNFKCVKLKDVVMSPEKESVADGSGISDDVTNADMLPYVHLTRFDKSGMTKTQKNYLQAAEDASGVLKKEMKYATSCYDSDVTGSSSDEEVTEISVVTSKFQRSKSTSKSGPKQSVTRSHKSFCKWVAERAELSRRWTWLQSKISSLELSIRQQGELYGQLRNDKGDVQLDALNCQSRNYVHQSGNMTKRKVADPTPAAVSPCNVNLLVNNIHHQSSRLFNKLSPVSDDSPSPNLPLDEARQTVAQLPESILDKNIDVTLDDVSDTCSRTRPLQLSGFRNRRLVKITPTTLVLNKPQKPAAVPNDSSIMCAEQNITHTDKFEDHLVLKAALHDHSYHSVISSIKDIPLSVAIRAIMKSRRNWCRKSSSHKRDKIFNKHKSSKKMKHKVQKKTKRVYSAVVSCNKVEDSGQNKSKKLTGQVSDSSKKRTRGGSFDSDIDAPVVGRINSHQSTPSGTTTPTSEITGQHPGFWKKKKSSEQAYDINNIIIPYGLNSARIEKLPYKEIQTPRWKVMELSPVKEVPNSPASKMPALDFEDTSYEAFQNRHDSNEIIEKRKYTAFIEWSNARKGRGSRMGNIYAGPTTPDPESPPSMSCTSSPLSFFGEPISNCSLQRAPSTSPTAKLGVTTRRMSIDHTYGRLGALPLQQTQRNTDTSPNHSYSSSTLAVWQDGLCSRRGSETGTIMNRSLSDGFNVRKMDQAVSRTWDVRTFPLNEEDLRFLNDVGYAKAKLYNDDMHMETNEGVKRNPLIHQGSGEKVPAEHTRTTSNGSIVDLKSSSAKRRRIDSTRASSLASYDDTARHSDASSASISSNQRKHRRTTNISRKKGATGNGNAFTRTKESVKSEHKYLHVRLSETEDSLTDTADSDSNSSDEETSSSYDDAGHIVDDYADPEWEAPRYRDCR